MRIPNTAPAIMATTAQYHAIIGPPPGLFIVPSQSWFSFGLQYYPLTTTAIIEAGGDLMGINGGRNLRGIEGNPEDEGLYQRVNISLPPSLLARLEKYRRDEDRPRSWVIQKAIDEWLKKKGY